MAKLKNQRLLRLAVYARFSVQSAGTKMLSLTNIYKQYFPHTVLEGIMIGKYDAREIWLGFWLHGTEAPKNLKRSHSCLARGWELLEVTCLKSSHVFE